MTETTSQFQSELRLIQERIDRSTIDIQNLSAEQKALSQQVESQQDELRARQDRKQRIQNLRRAIGEIRERLFDPKTNNSHGHLPKLSIGDADSDYLAPESPIDDE